MTTDSVEVIKRRESVAPSKKLREDIKCALSDCNILKYKTSSEEMVTKVTESRYPKDDDVVFDHPPEPQRRISIAFTGKSVIYERDEDDDDSESEKEVRKEPVKKHRIKSKKTGSTKTHRSKKGK